jgi:hypothetical protein
LKWIPLDTEKAKIIGIYSSCSIQHFSRPYPWDALIERSESDILVLPMDFVGQYLLEEWEGLGILNINHRYRALAHFMN